MGRDKAKVREAIDRSVKDGVPLDFIESCDGYTGAIAILDTGREGPTTAFRFDIDGLLVMESEDPNHLPVKFGFASKRPGRMRMRARRARRSPD